MSRLTCETGRKINALAKEGTILSGITFMSQSLCILRFPSHYTGPKAGPLFSTLRNWLLVTAWQSSPQKSIFLDEGFVIPNCFTLGGTFVQNTKNRFYKTSWWRVNCHGEKNGWSFETFKSYLTVLFQLVWWNHSFFTNVFNTYLKPLKKPLFHTATFVL